MKEGSVKCTESKYIAALKRLEKKVQCSNSKYSAALTKLEEKVQNRKANKDVSYGAFVDSFSDKRRNSLHKTAGPPSVIAVSSVLETYGEERPARSESPVPQSSRHEQGAYAESGCPLLKRGVSHSSITSTKSLDKTQSSLSAQDLHSVNSTVIEENDLSSEWKSSGDPYNDEKDVGNKEVSSDESSSDSNKQRLKESVYPAERINSDLIKVFQCNFCSTYYLYYESYQEHKKKCLTCSRCNLTFPSIFELYKHITSKAHKEYFSFLDVCKWTQSQLKLRISRNEVHASDVKQLALLELGNQEKELSALVTDSSIGQSVSSSDQNQANVDTCSLPCVSAPDFVTSTPKKNESLNKLQYFVENKTYSKHGEEISSPACNKETRKPLEENNNKTSNEDCLDGMSDGNINTDISRSLSKESSNDHKQRSKHSTQSPQIGKSERKLKENENTYKKASVKPLNIETPKSKKDFSKSLQKTTKDCNSPQNKNNRTAEKASSDSEPERMCLKVPLLQSGIASVEKDQRKATPRSLNKKEKESQGKIPQKQECSNKKLYREHSSSRTLKSKSTRRNLLQGTDERKSKFSIANFRKIEVFDEQVSSAGLRICHSSNILTSSCDKDGNSKNAISSRIQTSSTQGSENSKRKIAGTSGHIEYPRKRLNSFEDPAPKAIKLLMKTLQVTSKFVISSRKIDVIPESCLGCSNRIDTSTAVYNTKTKQVSFWCRTCSCDIVFSADA